MLDPCGEGVLADLSGGDAFNDRDSVITFGVVGRVGPGSAVAVATLATRAGINRRMTPHTLRHAAITAALNAGAPLRDAQDFARNADPKTTMRYDRNRHSLDRHATYAIAQYIAGSE